MTFYSWNNYVKTEHRTPGRFRIFEKETNRKFLENTYILFLLEFLEMVNYDVNFVFMSYEIWNSHGIGGWIWSQYVIRVCLCNTFILLPFSTQILLKFFFTTLMNWHGSKNSGIYLFVYSLNWEVAFACNFPIRK